MMNETDFLDLTKLASSELPTRFEEATIHIFQDNLIEIEHVVLQFGEFGNGCIVRIHSECLTGEVLHSLRCDCGDQLNEALELISANDGLLIYLRKHEGRGIGLGNKIKAYSLQDSGLNTIEANHQLGFPTDQRDFKVSADILKFFGISSIQLLTNNPSKVRCLEAEGIEVEKRIGTRSPMNKHNKDYLRTKAGEMEHIFDKGSLYG